jgi:branched-chain amino acid transport system permease protein
MVRLGALLRRESIRLVILALGLLAIHLLVSNQFHRSIVQVSIIFAIASVGLTLLIGFAGQVSLCQGAFVGLGAYVTAFAVQRMGWPSIPALMLATAVSAAVAYAIARPILRLSGHYLALATLALGTSAYILASQWRDVTGGLDPGIVDVPRFRFLGLSVDELFLFSSACLVLTVGAAGGLVHSRLGRALRAIRTSEIAAAGMGIDVAETKAKVFAWAAAAAGLSGALYAFFLRSFNAGTFGIGLSIDLLMMVIVGSLSTVWGALLGAFLIILLPNLLENFDTAKLLVYGVAMTAIVMFMPNGLASGLLDLLRRTGRRGQRAP